MMKDICPSIVDDTDTVWVFHEQTTMKRATCYRSIYVNKDADKFNSEYKNNIPMKTNRQCVYAHAKQV